MIGTLEVFSLKLLMQNLNPFSHDFPDAVIILLLLVPAIYLRPLDKSSRREQMAGSIMAPQRCPDPNPWSL